MKQQPPLTRSELEALHSVLRRAAERAERRKDPDAERLEQAVADLNDEMAGERA